MIQVYTNKENYQYDLHSLIKAFYPERDVKVHGLEQISRAEERGRITVSFEEKALHVVLAVQGGKVRVYDNPIETDEEEGTGVHLYKNACKLALYRDLCDYTGRTLPWGNLTGIRPTKLPMGMLAEGLSDEEIMHRLEETHAVSEEKSSLSLDIAKREKALLDTIHYEDGYSLYIGIPFCPTTCLYCSFTSYPIAMWKKRVQDYLEAVYKEMQFVADAYKDKILDTVYIGGGTPTTLEAGQLDWLLTKLKNTFDWSQVKEFTVEAGRADSITPEKLAVLHQHGVTRISVNPQTMKDETLKFIGRRHTVAQVKEAFAWAREAGFDNINMDLIAGLPGEDLHAMKHTLEEIRALAPESLTVHSLAIKRAANLNQQMDDYKSTIHHDMDAMHTAAQETAQTLGMEPYYLYRQKNIGGNLENVGYAKPGCECLYNILIMEEMTDIIAAGAGASTKLVYHAENRVERVENCKSVDDYINRFDEMLDRKRKAF